MADYLLYFLLIVWSIWGVLHALRRKGVKCNINYDFFFCIKEGSAYEIKNKQKKTMVLFAEGPIVWFCKSLEVLWIVFATITKFVLVVPFKALDRWAQEDEKESDTE